MFGWEEQARDWPPLFTNAISVLINEIVTKN